MMMGRRSELRSASMVLCRYGWMMGEQKKISRDVRIWLVWGGRLVCEYLLVRMLSCSKWEAMWFSLVSAF